MNDIQPTPPLQRGMEKMRGLIHTHGIEKASGIVASAVAPPFNTDESDVLKGMILAAFEAGQLDGMTNKRVS